jgi:uncharacterized ferritin-like protein (DUF455 family)
MITCTADHAPDELRAAALHWLAECDTERKVQGVAALAQAPVRSLDAQAVLRPKQAIPGRPQQPELVDPRLLKRRSMTRSEGRAIMIHALAHIEFNAINLALDAIWRFPSMPHEYYLDWLQVAGEEALHFSLLNQHLQFLGYRYGDFPAHNGLWEAALKTQHDLLARIALVPRTMEARGLDVTPKLRAKLAQAGDAAAAEIFDIILRDEIDHVAIGNRWFAWLCQQCGIEPLATYRQLVSTYEAPPLHAPLNVAARMAAGFSQEELTALQTGVAAVPEPLQPESVVTRPA